MTKPLLIEVGVEEIPAIPFLKELPNIEKKWLTILEEYNLVCEFAFYYTPRRLVFWHREFSIVQADSEVEFIGAPTSIAYKDGVATNAAISFAKKCGVEVENLGKTTKDGKEVLYFKQSIKGKSSHELLNEMINKLFVTLNFGKSMRWATRSDSFIRPIRWVSVMLGDRQVPVELFGKKSAAESYGHRMVSFEPFSYSFCGDYFCKLEKSGVVLYPQVRRQTILEQIKNIELQNNITVELDEELLDEVVAITEKPTALLGSFEEHFLALPPEVIITSMKTNQRYFAVFKDGKLTNKFIVVANAITDNFDKIVAGNERVLRPRLSDAMFFYKNDLNNGFNIEGLKNIIFLDGLGSVYEKVQREIKISEVLAQEFCLESINDIKRATYLAKGDLLTQVVYEFTELQGLIGSYYAKEFGESELVATAISEQYLPSGENSVMPSSIACAIVAMSNKIDTLMALFSIGKVPTGNKDPFALRRAATGLIKIALEHKMNINFSSLFKTLAPNYLDFDLATLNEFVNERMYQIFVVNPSILKAVLGSGDGDIYSISQKVLALKTIVSGSDFKEISSTFKRVANIIKDLKLETTTIDDKLFEQSEETSLFVRFNAVNSINYNTIDEKLEALFGLKPELDSFFDKVLVNHENESIKNNRKNLIASVYLAFKDIADIKEISL